MSLHTTAEAASASTVPLHVVVRARDVETFIARYRQHLEGDRIFIFTKVPPSAGTRVRFRIFLATGDCLIYGEGVVLRSVPDGAAPASAGGMEVRFVPLDDASRRLIDSLRARAAGDGVPTAVIDDEKTIATGPPEFFTPAGPAPTMIERGDPGGSAISGDGAEDDPFDLSDAGIDYFVDWSPPSPSRRPPPPPAAAMLPSRRCAPVKARGRVHTIAASAARGAALAWSRRRALAARTWRYAVVAAVAGAAGFFAGVTWWPR
ncbi:MAG: hypothetical protein LC659_11650 [Myxococcales bacterium]|nr:hypothetical protein [Myxococcales bacterium]